MVYKLNQPIHRTHCIQLFPSTSCSLGFNFKASVATEDLHPQNSQDNKPLSGNVWPFVSILLSSAWALSPKSLPSLMKRTEGGTYPQDIFLMYFCYFVKWGVEGEEINIALNSILLIDSELFSFWHWYFDLLFFFHQNSSR